MPGDRSMQRVIGWLTAVIVITLIFGSAYAALQQLGRRSANAGARYEDSDWMVMIFLAPDAELR